MNKDFEFIASVIVPVFNKKNHLVPALDSILSQKISDCLKFETIIVDDCCDDGSSDIIANYSKKHSSVKIIKNLTNVGISASLNKALEIAKGKYIIRMDCDDICIKDRFNKQINFMEKNPDIGISGTAIEIIDNKGNIQGKNYYLENDKEIRCKMIFDTAFAHPSVIIRKSILDQHNLKYNEDFLRAQDFELFSRLINYTKASNLNEVLLKYRHQKNNFVFKKTFDYASKVRVNNLLNIGFTLNEIYDNLDGINCLVYLKTTISQNQFENLIFFFNNLIKLYLIKYGKNNDKTIINFYKKVFLKIIYRNLIFDRQDKKFKNLKLIVEKIILFNNFVAVKFSFFYYFWYAIIILFKSAFNKFKNAV